LRPPSPAGRLGGSDLEDMNMKGLWRIREQDGRRQGWYLLGTAAGSVLCGIARRCSKGGTADRCRDFPRNSRAVNGSETLRRMISDDRVPHGPSRPRGPAGGFTQSAPARKAPRGWKYQKDTRMKSSAVRRETLTRRPPPVAEVGVRPEEKPAQSATKPEPSGGDPPESRVPPRNEGAKLA